MQRRNTHKKFRKSNKRNTLSLQKTAKLIATQSLALLVGVPYLVWKCIFPKKRIRKGSVFSRLFRRVLELKKTKHFIGINIASLLVLFSVVQVPSTPYGGENPLEESSIKPETVITTESSFRVPVPGYISQGYSWYHPGIDIAGNDNSIIYPIAPGRVVQIEYSRFGYGISIIVDHGDTMISRYAHLSRVKVSLNQEVDKDMALGYVGSTGLSTGPHLHLEVYEGGKTINPLTVFSKDYARNVTYTITPSATGGATIASAQSDGKSYEDVPVATLSAEISYKEVVDGFEEPFAYQAIATSSATTVTLAETQEEQ